MALIIESNTIDFIYDCLCTKLNCDPRNCNSLIKRFRRKAHATLGRSVSSAPLDWVREIALRVEQTASIDQIPGLSGDYDVQQNEYEGGFKLWEGALDLAKYIKDNKIITSFADKPDQVSVLELGTGAGLPSLLVLKQSLRHNINVKIHLQDYNWQVLKYLTLTNVCGNFSRDIVVPMIANDDMKFFPGSWKNLNTGIHYDLIITSETIYNRDFYDDLHGALERHLKPGGKIIMASKGFYFGCSGNVPEWLEFISARETFVCEHVINTNQQGVQRFIHCMKYK